MRDEPPPNEPDIPPEEHALKVGKWMESFGFHELLGIRVAEAKPGWCRATMEVTKPLLNPFGITHGGAVFTLAEFAYGVAGNADGQAAVGLMTSMTFPASSREGDTLTAEAREMASGSRTGHYQVEVRRSDGQIVGIFTGVLFRRGDPLSHWMRAGHAGAPRSVAANSPASAPASISENNG